MFVFLVLFISYSYTTTGLRVGEDFPEFEADTTDGHIKFHNWRNGGWAILLSYPADYIPVATTELARAIRLEEEFKNREVKMIALSCDSLENHREWAKDIVKVSGTSTALFPIIPDPKIELAVKLGLIDSNEKDGALYTAVFIIGPSGKLRLFMWYPVTTGINFTELLRVIDSMQLADKKKVATPADWKPGERCIVQQSVEKKDYPKYFPKGAETQSLPSGQEYLTWTPQP